ncbi:uncharacterized protein LOC116345985 [Contarinia nasturtii]|uniref:uncharacterized protein LOC116345985 n=1 Tax=Contarinia nasturtii TaxID=265458 RepID=UPI0012D4106A|nr:uncharacterized protein LOC116345985 [Contarinia nasturtii]
MFRIGSFVVVAWMVSISDAIYDEVYRPQLHYSPPKGWLSDPNGLIYGNGIYHMFHQCQPDDANTISDIHWGHAISTDLIHWKTLEPALYPPDKGTALFSGGAIFDYKNITGLQTNSNIPTLILMPAPAVWKTRKQNVWLAYSNDAPEYVKFKYYEKNPIIRGPPDTEIITAFRDLTVFKHQDYYVSIIATYNRMQFYHSRNLLKWELVSEFGEFDGAHTGRWECPSLFEFTVPLGNGKQIKKHVLLVTITDYAQPAHQYFVGSFDGRKFTNDNSKDTILWVEYGPDCFAEIIYYDLPDGRCISMNWMGRWEYAENLNFKNWNGQMGLPRELKLIKVGNQFRLTSLPVREINSLRINPVRKKNINIMNVYQHEIADSGKKRHLADIEMTMDLKKLKAGDTFDIVFSGKRDELKISLKNNVFYLDRSRSGKIVSNYRNPNVKKGNIDNPDIELAKMDHSFGGLWEAPRLTNSTNLKLRIIIDTNGIEMFADDGLTSMSALFFSEDGIASKMTIQVHSATKKSLIQLKELNVYEMKSIWHNEEGIKKKIELSAHTKKLKSKKGGK